MQRTFVRLLMICLSLGFLLASIAPARAATHTSTEIWGAVNSNGVTTDIRMRICGTGTNFRFGVGSPAAGTPSWDSGDKGAINGCDPVPPYGYNMVFNASVGEVFKFYSLVADGPVPADHFARYARKDICSVVAKGQVGCNSAPFFPMPTGPANGVTLSSGNVTLSWPDPGDPDNAPRNYRDYYAEIWKSDHSWNVASGWQTATSWNLPNLGNGTYVWHVKAGDGAIGGDWSDDWSFTVDVPSVTPTPTQPPPSVNHTNTTFGAEIENGKTTIRLRVCGTGPMIRFSSELKGDGSTTFLGDWTRTGVSNTCSPAYRPVIGADVNAQVRFYSTVLDQNISESDFRMRARKDVCKVTAPGQITCTSGPDWQAGSQPPVNTNNPAQQLNLIFPLAPPVYITWGYHAPGSGDYSVDFGIAGNPENKIPVLATHSGYLSAGTVQGDAGIAWCAYVSSEPDSRKSQFVSAYCHITAGSVPASRIGTRVNQGEQIALMGKSGTTRVHVHYDLRFNGAKIKPIPMCGETVLAVGYYASCKPNPVNASATITSGGGTLAVRTGRGGSAVLMQATGASTAAAEDFTFQFPQDATQADLTAEYREVFASTQPLSGRIDRLRAFRLDVYDAQSDSAAQLQKPYAAVIRYSDAEVAALGINEASLDLRFYDGSGWISLLPCEGCGVDTANNRITVVLNRFGEFALVGKLESKVFLPLANR